jgi:signal transduction histidine kinase
MNAKPNFLSVESGLAVEASPPELPGERARLLVVDDENGPRQALRMLLKEDYDVTLAPDVPTAMEIVRAQPLDLVITDIRMPRYTGVDLLRQVKEIFPDIQVIILTGYGQLETAMKAVEYGAFAYLEKPFDNDVLLNAVRAALTRRTEELERRRLEQLALEANRFDLVGRVVSGMLHDLGTPLTVIGNHIELLMYDPNPSEMDARLGVMFEQVNHCSSIVRATMDFLRHQSQKPVPLNLNDVVKACLDVGKPLFRKQKIAVTKDLAQGLALCVGDFVLIRQAILNLVTNACQAMREQEEPQAIHLSTWNENGHACLAVADTGPGIPPEKRHKVFETFFTTKGKAGTGLGLAVVQNVMRQHNGDVTLGENSPRGARFVLRFPVAPADGEADGEGAEG